MNDQLSQHEWRRRLLVRMNDEFLQQARFLRKFNTAMTREPYDRRSPIEHAYDREFLRQLRSRMEES